MKRGERGESQVRLLTCATSKLLMEAPLWSLMILIVIPVRVLVRATKPALSPDSNVAAINKHNTFR